MKLFTLLALFLPLLAFAGNGSGNVSEIVNTSIPSASITAGGGSVLSLGDITSGTVYQIYAFGGTGTDYYPFWKNGTQFTVATGHKAYCISGTALAAGAWQNYQLVSATASFANGATSLTGGVYQCGSSASTCATTGPTTGSSGPMAGPYMFDGTAAQVWPGFMNNSSSINEWLSMTCTTI